MTLLAGIIGYPLGHSVSPAFQQAALDHHGMDARYEAWVTPPEELAGRLHSLRGPDMLGASVTVPHKEAVIRYLDRLTPEARRTGAVNTIVHTDGGLEGHNTDMPGFLRALREDGGLEPSGRRALLLGAGGAARAVAFALVGQGIAGLSIANRTVERAQSLVSDLDTSIATAMTLDAAALSAPDGWDLVVNCTTLGMLHSAGESETPIPANVIPPDALVCDLVYNPQETPLLRAAAQAGARTLGGLPMLVYQGAEAFRLWTGREPPIDVMFDAARRALAGM
jgi:shikimate dehydrogenase